MIRTRMLFSPRDGRAWGTSCDGPVVTVRSGPPGREKTAEKHHPDAASALRWAEKEEWARLKQGMVLVDSQAPAGAPRMHRHIGGSYTGALALAADGDGGLICNRSGGADEVLRVAANAEVSIGLTLPANHLVWKAVPAPSLGVVLLQVDGGVLRWTPGGTVEPLTSGQPGPGFLSVAGTRAAWYEPPDVVMRDLAGGVELLRHSVTPEVLGGHSPQLEGALSPDGRRLAVCSRSGEIQLFDVERGAPPVSLAVDFAMARRLEFLPDGRRLMLQEDYGRWSLRCLDVDGVGPLPGWADLESHDHAEFAIDASGRRLAVANSSEVTIYSLAAEQPSQRFTADHVVKRCALAWVGDDSLATRTDYGCASIYAVG